MVLPGGHTPCGGVGVVLPIAQTKPASHGKQDRERGGEYFPAGHSSRESTENKRFLQQNYLSVNKKIVL